MESGTVAKVLRDVFTTMEGELSLSKGDIFQVIKAVDKYWCHGNCLGKVGLFPTDQLIPIETPEMSDCEELFLAIADFVGEQEGDLHFRKGEFIVGEKKLDEHWWQGRVSYHRRGVFPDTFTWHLNSTPQKIKKNKGVMNVKAKVKMNLKAQLDEEMDLHVGDIVTVIEETDKGWYRGTCGERSGIFPSAYVTLMEEYPSSTASQDECIQDDNLSNFSRPVWSENNNSLSASINHDRGAKNISNQSSDKDGDSLKDLMTFSPEKEIKTVGTQSLGSELDILDDDYFKVNMPSMYSKQLVSEPEYQSYSDYSTGESSLSNKSYLVELVNELDDCSIQPYGMTIYPFYAQYSNELSFHENEIVHLIRYVDDEWLEGEIDGRKGIFPVSYINILVDCDRGWRTHSRGTENEINQCNLSARSYAKVMYNFDAQMNGDLSVKEGDIVMIMKNVDEDWCEVRNKVGGTGLCPSNHLVPHNASASETLFRSSSFSSNLEPVSIGNQASSRSFEPHDFSTVCQKSERKVEDLISKNLSKLDVVPSVRKQPIGKDFIDYKEELNVVKSFKSDDTEELGLSSLDSNGVDHILSSLKEEYVKHDVGFEHSSSSKPPNYPPPPPPRIIQELPCPTSSNYEKSDNSKLEMPRKVVPLLPPDYICSQPPCQQPDDKIQEKQPTPPSTPLRPERPPPPMRLISVDRAPHRPAPPVPIAGQTPVRKSLKRLPRQTSAPCVLSEVPNDTVEIMEIISTKEKQLQELQKVHEEIEGEIQEKAEEDSHVKELRLCGASNEKKMRRLKLDIQRFKEKLSKGESELSNSCGTRLTIEKKMKMNEQRQNVISELVMTEKEYVRDLKMTYEVFNLHNPSMLEERGIDVNALFGNILEVMHAAEGFLDSLQFAMKGLSDEDQCVGPVFLKHADQIKKVYSEYCTNHESALGLLDKYKTIPAAQAVFDKAMETLRYQITCFNVGSVLIKPVQRLLKYPLILNELIKCTEDSHKDKSDLLKAVKVYTDMASDINEYKRRKDIVSKYLGDGTSTLARKMAKLNLHSVAKKSSRLSAKLSSTLGLSMAPKDELFSEQDRSFHTLERTLRILLRDLDTLMNHLSDEIKALFHLGEVLAMYYMDRSKDQDVDEFRTTQRLIVSQYWVEFKNVVERRVTVPLLSLLDLFQGPSKLIEKRNDKLLDYDNYLAKAEKSKENRQLQDELLKSKSNYEALNQQLLEDLPELIKSSTEILVECLSALLTARKLLSGKITKQYLSLMEIPSLASTAGDAIEAFAVKHYLVCNQLGRFSFSSKTFRESGGSKKSLKTSPTPSRQLGTDGQQLVQSASQRAYLQSRYTSDKLFSTIEDHVTADALDLALCKGHLVGVIKKQDPMGNSHRWFVDNGVAQGFVRSSILEPAASLCTSPSNSLSSKSSGASPSPNRLRPDSASSGRSSDMGLSPRQSLSPPKESAYGSGKSDVMPPSYEEVTGASTHSLPIEVPSDMHHIYDEVPPTSVDNNNIYEEIRTFDEVESPAATGSSSDSEFFFSLYDFPGMGPHTLPLKNGQVVHILQRHDLQGNKEWWHVEDRYGNRGYVPANYLHPYTDS